MPPHHIGVSRSAALGGALLHGVDPKEWHAIRQGVALVGTLCLHCVQAALDELRTTTGRADYPSHSQPIADEQLGPSRLGLRVLGSC